MKTAARKENPMTMDKLAKMIKAGFDNTATKDDISKLDQKVEKMDERLAIVETKLDNFIYFPLESGRPSQAHRAKNRN
jgi:hypothetical protein